VASVYRDANVARVWHRNSLSDELAVIESELESYVESCGSLTRRAAECRNALARLDETPDKRHRRREHWIAGTAAVVGLCSLGVAGYAILPVYDCYPAYCSGLLATSSASR